MSQEPENKIDDELSEEELNKIFLGTDPNAVDEPIAEPAADSKAIKVPVDKKGNPIKGFDGKPIVPPVWPEAPKKSGRPKKHIKEEVPLKRPEGRPKFWTAERIAQLKLDKKLAAIKRKEDLKNQTDLAKISINPTVLQSKTQYTAEKNTQSRSEIEKEFSEKRTIIKDAINQEANTFVYQRSSCKEHKYRIDSFEGNEVVSACIHCSCIKKWSIADWDRYNQPVLRQTDWFLKDKKELKRRKELENERDGK